MEYQGTQDTRDLIHAWLYTKALPLWASLGLDKEAGGFFECLTFQGEPVEEAPKRLRVQARQVYVYSHAAILDWDGPALQAAKAGYTFLIDHYWHADGGWIFSVTRTGEPVDQAREAYEQAFALLAFAWLYRATRDENILQSIKRTIDFLDDRLSDQQHGGYRDSIPDKPIRRQNPHMHLLEAFLALYESTKDTHYLERAKSLTKMVQTTFQDPDSGALLEYFTDTWAHTPAPEGKHVEPGHHFEWVWLLHQYAKLSGDRTMLHPADRLYRLGTQYGLDKDGLAFDGMWPDGTTRMETKRFWPQTEALRAHMIQEDLYPDSKATQVTDSLISTIYKKYLSVGKGLWQDHIQRDGTGFATYVPASTFYHIFQAFTEYLKRRAT